MLEHDHQIVKSLFKSMKSKKSDHDNIFEQISKELTVHFSGEEELLYPVLEEKGPTHEKTLESWEEHNYAKEVLKDLKGMNKQDEHWQAKLTVLQEMVEHHIQEEEGILFKQAQKVIDKAQSDEIGRRYHEKKEQMNGPMKS
jgi:iron-sulfur cluster repair protein YtfE (RIC family)